MKGKQLLSDATVRRTSANNIVTKPSRRRTRKKPNAQYRPLPKEEWSFGKVPPRELKACLWYEYARESRRALRDVSLWLIHYPFGTQFPTLRIERDRIAADADAALALWRFYRSPVRIALASPQFPNIAWMKIPSRERRKAMRDLRWQEAEDYLDLCKKRSRGKGLAKLAREAFRVGSWGLSDEQLVERFRRWLVRTRPKRPDPPALGRKQSPFDLLNHLGALRLMKHAKREGRALCEVLALSTGGEGAPPKEPKNVNRDAHKAKSFLKNLYR